MPEAAARQEPAAPSVHVDHLQVRYGRARGPVIEDLTWQIPRGRTGLLGPNGAGKSTLIKALTGDLRPARGSISFTDTDPVVGYVPQASTLPGHMRARDAVEYVAWMNGMPQGQLTDHVSDALRRVDLLDKAGARVKQLSGGQQQRLLLACGIVRDPSVLILDEPTAGLDPSQRLNIRKAVAELDPRCLLLATHLLEDVEYLCDHVAVLVGGSIRWAGSLSEFTSELVGHAEESAFGSRLEVAYEAFIAGLDGPGVQR